MLQEQFEVERAAGVRLPPHRRRAFGRGSPRPASPSSATTPPRPAFNHTSATLRDQGFPESGVPGPGIPSLGHTGIDNDPTYRGDFRQEVDFPFSAGQFRVPALPRRPLHRLLRLARRRRENRLFGGRGRACQHGVLEGGRYVESRMFDLHRMRHVIEPELNALHQRHHGRPQRRVPLRRADRRDHRPQRRLDGAAAAVADRARRAGPAAQRRLLHAQHRGHFFANEPRGRRCRRRLPRPLLRVAARGVRRRASRSMSTPPGGISDTTVVLADAQCNLDEQSSPPPARA